MSYKIFKFIYKFLKNSKFTKTHYFYAKKQKGVIFKCSQGPLRNYAF